MAHHCKPPMAATTPAIKSNQPSLSRCGAAGGGVVAGDFSAGAAGGGATGGGAGSEAGVEAALAAGGFVAVLLRFGGVRLLPPLAGVRDVDVCTGATSAGASIGG